MVTASQDPPRECGDPVEADALLRLRSFVHASPRPDGILVRGWAAAFTISGGASLWRLWQRLAPMLADGMSPADLDAMTARSATRNVVRLVIEQLRVHRMLVGVPAAWTVNGAAGSDRPPAAVAGWLEAVAADPARAWRRVSRASVAVEGSGPLADATTRALAATGLRAAAQQSPPGRAGIDRRPGIVQLVADTTAVAAGVGSHRGFVTPPNDPDAAARAALGIAERIMPKAFDDPSHPLTALVAGAAAHRLACAVAEVRDPAEDAALLRADGSGPVPGPWPMVLVARAVPLAGAFHPWIPGAEHVSSPDAETLDGALRRLGAVCDPELGVLPPPDPRDLPQLPAALAVCCPATNRPAVDEVIGIGIGASLGAARLDAALRAAALVLGRAGAAGQHSGLAVGADRRHVDGLLLRRAAANMSTCLGTAVHEHAWAADPVAWRWWKALTLRFAVVADATTKRLADGAFLARIRAGTAELAAAVEATPGDAMAFAAFVATATVQARRAGFAAEYRPPTTTCGATPPLTPPEVGSGQWRAEPWAWPGARPAELRLQAALRGLLPPEQHPVPLLPSDGNALLESLTAAGFAVARATGTWGAGG